jgi:hypothetical protein
MSTAESESFTQRPATPSDVPAIYGLLQAHKRALYGYADTILAYVQAPYSSPTLNFAEETCLVFDRAGQLVGSMLLEQSQYASFGVTVCVFPASAGYACGRRSVEPGSGPGTGADGTGSARCPGDHGQLDLLNGPGEPPVF